MTAPIHVLTIDDGQEHLEVLADGDWRTEQPDGVFVFAGEPDATPLLIAGESHE